MSAVGRSETIGVPTGTSATRLKRSASLRRSATTDGRSETIASINSRRLRWHCLVSSGAASTPDTTRPRIRAAIGAAFTLGTCPTPIRYSRDSDNIEREIETIERELSGCRGRDDEFTNVIVYSSSAEWRCFENADCCSDVPRRLRRASAR